MIEELIPATCHITEQHANNSVEADHGSQGAQPVIIRTKECQLTIPGDNFWHGTECDEKAGGVGARVRRSLPGLPRTFVRGLAGKHCELVAENDALDVFVRC